jgi:hypothetical protein
MKYALITGILLALVSPACDGRKSRINDFTSALLETEVSMNFSALSSLDILASQMNDPGGLQRFVDALLNFVGPDDLLIGDLRKALLKGESLRLAHEGGLMDSHEFLGAVQRMVAELGMEDIFNISDEDLFRARKALSKTMPHFFSAPEAQTNLRASERFYLLYLLWSNGTLGKDDRLTPEQMSGTIAVASNGRRSEYLGKRNMHLRGMSQTILQNTFTDVCDVIGEGRTLSS